MSNEPIKRDGCEFVCEVVPGTQLTAYGDMLIAVSPNLAPMMIDVDLAAGRDFTATALLETQRVGYARMAWMWDGIASRMLAPLIDRVYELALGAPRRRRWDLHGAYHRRQLKKWRKQQAPFSFTIAR